MALSGAHRLSLRFERERITKTGITVFGKFYTLVSSDIPKDKDQSTPRFAIITSKKTAPLATDRNKIKRITSGILESLLPSLPPKDYLIIPKRQVLTENNQIIKEDLKNIFPK